MSNQGQFIVSQAPIYINNSSNNNNTIPQSISPTNVPPNNKIINTFPIVIREFYDDPKFESYHFTPVSVAGSITAMLKMITEPNKNIYFVSDDRKPEYIVARTIVSPNTKLYYRITSNAFSEELEVKRILQEEKASEPQITELAIPLGTVVEPPENDPNTGRILVFVGVLDGDILYQMINNWDKSVQSIILIDHNPQFLAPSEFIDYIIKQDFEDEFAEDLINYLNTNFEIFGKEFNSKTIPGNIWNLWTTQTDYYTKIILTRLN